MRAMGTTSKTALPQAKHRLSPSPGKTQTPVPSITVIDRLVGNDKEKIAIKARNTKTACISKIKSTSTRGQTPVRSTLTSGRNENSLRSSVDKNDQTVISHISSKLARTIVNSIEKLSRYSNSIQSDSIPSSEEEDNEEIGKSGEQSNSDELAPHATAANFKSAPVWKGSKQAQPPISTAKVIYSRNTKSYTRATSMSPIAKRVAQTPVALPTKNRSTLTSRRNKNGPPSTSNISGLAAINKNKNKASSFSATKSKPVSNISSYKSIDDIHEGGKCSNSNALASTTRPASNLNAPPVIQSKTNDYKQISEGKNYIHRLKIRRFGSETCCRSTKIAMSTKINTDF